MDNMNYWETQNSASEPIKGNILGKSHKTIILTGIVSFVTAVVLVFAAMWVFLGERGLTAFEIAQRNGFTGSEQDWLKSLKGPSGKDGKSQNEFVKMLEVLFDIEVAEGRWSGDFMSFLSTYFQGPRGETDLSGATGLAIRSAVAITTHFPGGSGASGSGVIYSFDPSTGGAYIMTNYHVISRFANGSLQVAGNNNSGRIDVFLFAMPTVAITARAVGGSAEHDIAILRVTNSQVLRNNSSVLRATDIPSRHEPLAGEGLIAVGNPLAGGISVTNGIVSKTSDVIVIGQLENPSAQRHYRVFRTSAAINPGNSGGGMFNMKGELMGIVMARVFLDGPLPIDNIGYVIPLDIALRVADQIIHRSGGGNTFVNHIRHILGMDVRGVNQRLALSGEEVLMIEDAQVAGFSNNPSFNVRNVFQVGDIIKSVRYTVRGKQFTQTLTQSYQLAIFMIDIYEPQTIVFNVLRGSAENQLLISIG